MDAKKESYAWGSRFYNQVSKDLSDELPDVKSFSPRNLLYMHQFYKLFPDALFVPQTDVKLPEAVITQQPVSRCGVTISITGNTKEATCDHCHRDFLIDWSAEAEDKDEEDDDGYNTAGLAAYYYYGSK